MSTKLRKDRKRNNKPYFKAAKVPTYTRTDAPVQEALPVACPTCGAVKGTCVTKSGKPTKRHAARVEA